MKDLIFYTTSSCHLCILAEELLIQIITPDKYIKVDIAESEFLISRYGHRIPVVRSKRGAELSWPFNYDLLDRFLSEQKCC